MQSSTVLTRTEAGRAELAVPAHGLSLAQRRFLTLLDTSRTVDELAQRHRAEAAKLDRDLSRLAELGLVVCDIGVPANDAEAAPPAAVRLGATSGSRLPWMLLLLAVAGGLAFAGWRQWRAADSAAADRNAHAPASRKATPDVQAAPVADPAPIATRVLKGDPAERTRDAAKESRGQPKSAERRPENPPAKPVDLPVEHRSPPHDDAAHASAPLVPGPVPPLQLAPIPVAAANPVPLSTPLLTPAIPGPAANVTAAMPPIQVATAAPASGLLRPAPLPALVPIAREPPSFPREAIALGLADGTVRARLTIDAKGNVSSVDIVEASHRAFTRTVRETLMRWRFEPGTAGRTTSVDVAFKRD
ncbi:MAG TPA: TonB family protein [Casimicrobiaceae bacterium]|nr:TonB family protein [Casimicrobiaceae bacterium]